MGSIGIVLFVAAIFGSAYAMNWVMAQVADKLGWFTQPLRKTRWYDKYTARISQWIFEKAEIYKIDF